MCETGLATMAELLDPVGPWSLDLLAQMAPVAMANLTLRKAALFRAVIAGVGGLFGGGTQATAYAKELDDTIRSARDLQAKRNGVELPTKEEQDADAFLEIIKMLPTKKG